MANHQFRCGRREALRVAAGITMMLGLATATRAAFGQASGAAPVRIGTIGAGHLGGTLGSLWAKAGHPVMFSSRHPEELKSLIDSAGPNAQAGTPEQAVAFAEVVLLAIPYGSMPQVAQDFGRDLAAKRLVVDASNPIPRRDGEAAAQAQAKGAGLAAAEYLPGARIVRAFNAIGYARLPEEAKRPQNERIGMPMAGDDPDAVALASSLVREVGLEPVVIGRLDMGKYLVPGTPLAGEHTPDQIRQIVASLK